MNVLLDINSGICIRPEALPLVVEMFRHVSASRERAQGRPGVGLTPVRRLAQLHGGTLEAQSEGHKHGVEFIVRLPTGGNRGVGTPGEQRSDFDRPVPSRRILVVDDNVDAATTLAALLRMQGHEVCTAHDGMQALDIVPHFTPDVAILDIGMPKMNGYALAQHIREIMGDARPLLIAVTGWGQEEARLRSKAAGFDHHLVKPVDPGALMALIAFPPGGCTLH